MRKCFLYIFCLAGLTLLLSNCKTSFDVNDPWKEENIIYALMTSKDSINTYTSQGIDSVFSDPQYFRITKMFSNQNSNALSIAQNPDSLYNKNWVVTLYEVNGGNVINTFVLQTDNTIPRDPGVFAYPHQILYRTPGNTFKINPASTYKILVYDTATKIKTTAVTSIVQPAVFQYYPTASHPLSFVRGDQHHVRTWNSGVNARFYDLTYTIHYLEWTGSNQNAAVEKTIDWPLFRNNLTNDLNGGQNFQDEVDGGDFYDKMSASIPVNPNVTRRMKGIEVTVASGGEDFYTYIQVNSPSLGITQKKTDFTNVTNGYGVFSSRAETKYFLPVDVETINTLINTQPTNTLGFIK